ncbi:MAG: hypothetical protein K9W45_12030 [Candidatus Heimdallarchaeum aukensis]|uniref:Uncharacterized protein n=1 Tax=Candidatus Heimdallarchaeum aukensis TaxID=2876573 RepID=A0A9Y1BK59_9ARCH|nr:MAG: hypothetical protein K9W45_12030 [Candidatus Heimdallarchaeum aukensis]
MDKTILQFFENEFQNIVRTHKINSHFNRYDSLPLFKSIINEYQKKYTLVKELISSALYTSDYIIMSSEVKVELDDEARRKEIIEYWLCLPYHDIDNWIDFTHLVAFIYHIASILRKRYYFQLDKGIPKKIASFRLASYFIRYLFEFLNKKSPVVPIFWWAALIETALYQSIFSKTLSQVPESLKLLDIEDIDYASYLIVLKAENELIGERNDTVPVPYVNETDIFHYYELNVNGKKKKFFDSNIDNKQKIEEIKKAFIDSASKLKVSENQPHMLKYCRMECKLEESAPLNFIIVCANKGDSYGWIGISSTIDDINLTKLEVMMKNKISTLLSLYKNKDHILDPLETETKTKKQSKGFFSKIKALFVKSVTITKDFERWNNLFLEEMLYNSVSGIEPGIEVYDSYREDNFAITALIQSQEKEENPTTFISEENVSYPTELLDPIIALTKFNYLFLEKTKDLPIISIIPEEAFYLDINSSIPRLLEFVTDGKIVVGILADKYQKTHKLSSKQKQIYKRRTIIRKARELLSIINSRDVTTLEDAGKRIISQDIDWNKVSTNYEQEKLFFSKK